MVHVAVIGAYGSAGVAAAEELAGTPEVDRLTLVDHGEPGGLCILRGCMPSKEVISAAAHGFQARHDDRVRGTPDIDLDAVVRTKDDHTDDFADHRRAAVDDLTDHHGVELVHDTARFLDDDRLALGDRDVLAPDHVVVATGSQVNVPDLPGIDDVDHMDSSDVLDARSLPDSGVVMGFGYVGLELVPYLAEAGVDLTVVEHDDRPLDEADPAFGDAVLDIYREKFGVEVLTDTEERALEATADGVRLHAERDGDAASVEAEALFLFTGRRPNLDGIGLENTSMDPGEGWVADTMQATANDRVFVVGDANGREPILHVAKEQGQTAAENIRRRVRGEKLQTYDATHHHVIFSGLGVYPYARVGHSEASAEQADLDFVAVTRQAGEDGVFETKNVPEGLASLVVDATDGTVLGYQGLHYHADVMAKTMQLAVEMDLDAREIPDRAYHPTTPEIVDGLLGQATEKLE